MCIGIIILGMTIVLGAIILGFLVGVWLAEVTSRKADPDGVDRGINL